MSTGIVAAALIALAVILTGKGVAWLSGFLRYRGKRVVTCPETQQPAGLEVDAVTAAGTALFEGPRFVVTACSRWPEREGCDQACVPQIELSPDATLVRNIVAGWYRGKSCIYCHKPIGDLTGQLVPALRTMDGALHDWDSIASEELPSLLSTAAAVCAQCELTEGFRLRLPHLVTDRAETPLRNRAVH